MFNFFRKKQSGSARSIQVDIHSHLLPDLDDGVEDYEESLVIINGFHEMGYRKLITTPHIMQDFYNNSEASITQKVKELNAKVAEAGIPVEVLAGAEYYLDDHLLHKVKNRSGDLLTFGNNYLLFETSFMNEPMYLKEFIFEVRSRGITPVMAHPERYAFIYNDFDMVSDLIDREVLLQVNINSFTGYYSKQVKKTAEKLVDKGLVHLLGSDCHNLRHFEVLKKARQEKYYIKALELPLINYNL
ncbi:capsular polysaccharide biosynthesis protein [Fulvivirga imtechensis AK7]|uniref:protein-tyrosine-phosphatase n=1 Tax=Fulvivirga imtechensis AK7 TaxID=1237149 RepID=L8JSH2_9BACT|nr:CpsB/CapC family capsule biosynthesis tyrosine phosphatase [Fulvivirga imtechensis]ELR71785.1 capsular polysaccharide biosynthesis protein [Fulvivirga imtechensis AK7]